MVKNIYPLESILSARQLINAKLYNDKIYFMSNMAGSYSLYEMNKSGSIPIPLLPEGTALQNPHLMEGSNFEILPKLNKIIVMMDDNGNELYQPCSIPLDGGIPEKVFGSKYDGMQLFFGLVDHEKNIAFFMVDNRKEPGYELLSYNFLKKEVISYGKSVYGNFPAGVSDDHTKVVVAEGYGLADTCYFLHQDKNSSVLIGVPLPERKPGTQIKPNGLGEAHFVENDSAIIIKTILYSDKGSICWMNLADRQNLVQLEIRGLPLPDAELQSLEHITEQFFMIQYNVDGTSHVYLAEYHATNERYLLVTHLLVGNDNSPLHNGVLLSLDYDHLRVKKDRKLTECIVSFTKATMPSQLYVISIKDKNVEFTKISNERVLGIPEKFLSEGEECNFISFDGLKVSARLYRPAPDLGYSGPRPLIYYVHGGPTGQERPDFTWFSMPLIQFLTLNGFSVFVPNVRGSTGYGTAYMKKVERDWGGEDLKDHLEALKHLEKDPLIDSTKRGVTGRSYGGYMTLSLISRHPNLWKAGIDMFGPYDLIGFYNRLPPSWQSAFDLVLGNPVKDKEFLIERSPRTYFDTITAPLLVIQGANDPRVLLAESKEIVETLKQKGKTIEMIVFEDEGHDVIKFKNKIKCYTEMVNFFKKHLMT